MGVDVVLWMAEPPTSAEWHRLAEQFRADWPVVVEFGDRVVYPSLTEAGEVVTLWRFYGECYERGPWPEIRKMIEWLWEHTGGDVRYGPDTLDDDDIPVISREEVEQIQAYYDAVGNEPYHSRHGVSPGPPPGVPEGPKNPTRKDQ